MNTTRAEPDDDMLDGEPLGQAASEALAVQAAGGVCAADPGEPRNFIHQVGHQRIAFSWPADESARFYRLQESRAGGGFKDIKGAESIAGNSFCLRIRHWDTDWGQMRYRLLACPGEGQPCAEAGSLGLTAEAAGRSVADIIDSGIRPTPDSQRRTALALSADGGTMAWAGSEPEGDMSLGRGPHTHLFNTDTLNISVREGGVWRLQASFRTGHSRSRGNSDIAKAVALSADGDVLAFGATDHVRQAQLFSSQMDRYSSRGDGAVYVYARDGGIWTMRAVLLDTARPLHSKFGTALAISADGRTLAAGRSLRNLGWTSAAAAGEREPSASRHEYHGSVTVFHWTGSEWAGQGDLRASGYGRNNFFGQSLALSADGDTLAVGIPGDGGGYQRPATEPDKTIDPVADSGAVRIYTRSGGSWRLGAYIKGKGARHGDRLGTSVSLNAAGDLLAAGAPRLGPGVSVFDTPAPGYLAGEPLWSGGAVYLFTLREGLWTQTARLSAGRRGAHDGFGASVSLSGSGGILAVGAPEETSGPGPQPCPQAGAVYVYAVSGEGAVLLRWLGDPRPRLWGQFGAFLALSADGETLAAAAPGWSTLADVKGRDLLERAKAREYGRRNFRSLYVY